MLAVVFPLSAHTGSDHFTIFIIPVNIEILPVLLQLFKVFTVQLFCPVRRAMCISGSSPASLLRAASSAASFSAL